LSVFSTLLTSMPSHTSIPFSLKTAAGSTNSFAFYFSSAHALATILPNAFWNSSPSMVSSSPWSFLGCLLRIWAAWCESQHYIPIWLSRTVAQNKRVGQKKVGCRRKT
jgi:hypothetical protein